MDHEAQIILGVKLTGTEGVPKLRDDLRDVAQAGADAAQALAKGEAATYELAEAFDAAASSTDGMTAGQAAAAAQWDAMAAAQKAAGVTAKAAAADAYDLADAERTVTASTADAGAALKGLGTYATQADADFEMLLKETLETTRAQKLMRAALDDTAKSGRTVVTSTAAVSQGLKLTNRDILTIGQSIQDFQAAGLLGISNNLDRLVMMVGGPAGLAATVMVAGAGFMAFGDKLKPVVEHFRGANYEVPKLGDALHAVEGELKDVGKRLDEYRDKQRLTNVEYADYIKLSERQVELEKTKADLAERKKRAEALDKLPDAAEAADAKERAQVLQDALGGQQEKITTAVQATLPTGKLEALSRERNRLVEEFNRLNAAASRGEVVDEKGRTIQKVLDQLEADIDKAERAVNAEAQARRDRAKDIVAKAMVEGDKEAFGQVRKAMGEADAEAFDQARKGGAARPQLFTDDQRAAFDLASPEAMEADRRFQDEIDARAAKGKERRERQAEAKRSLDEETRIADEALADSIKGVKKAFHGDDKDDRKELEKGASEAAKQTDEQVKALTAGSIDEEAAARAAQVRAAGGAEDRFGRFHKMDEREQEAFIANQVTQAIARLRPDMKGVQAMAASQEITGKAFKDVDAMRADREAQLIPQAMQGTRNAAERTAAVAAANQQAAADTLQAMNATLARVEMLERNQDVIGKTAAELNRRAQTKQRRGR